MGYTWAVAPEPAVGAFLLSSLVSRLCPGFLHSSHAGFLAVPRIPKIFLCLGTLANAISSARVYCRLFVWLVDAFLVSALRSVPFILHYNPAFYSLTPFLFVLHLLLLAAL